jgi:hypothetical protein
VTQQPARPPASQPQATDEAPDYESAYDAPSYGQTHYDDEPTFSEEDADPADASQSDTEPAGDEPSWRSLATASAMDFQLPSITRGERDDDEDDDYDGEFTESDFEESEFEEGEFDAEEDDSDQVGDHVDQASDVPAVDAKDTSSGAVAGSSTDANSAPPGEESAPDSAAATVGNATGSKPLTLLIPNPVTDLDDLAALVRFVATTHATMARRVEEVADGNRVLLIGATGAEDWTEIEQKLSSRGLTFERVTKKLSEALADNSLSGL